MDGGMTAATVGELTERVARDRKRSSGGYSRYFFVEIMESVCALTKTLTAPELDEEEIRGAALDIAVKAIRLYEEHPL